MLIKHYTIYLLLVIFANATLAKANLYSIEDLQILHSQKAYKEYLAHYLDIRPTKRDAKWQKMSQEVSTAFIEKQLKLKNINLKTFNLIESLANQPSISSHEFFQLRRGQYAAQYFNSCFHSKLCKRQFKKFLATSTANEEIDFKLYRLFKDTWPKAREVLLRRLSLSNVSEFYCNKDDLAYDLASLIIEKKSTAQTEISKIANTQCLKEIKKIIFKDMIIKSNPFFNQFYYKVFNQYKLLSTSEQDIFLFSYILNSPIRGDVLNLAWNRLEVISQDYKRRKTVLNYMTKLDPMPDKLFSKENLKSSSVFIKHINKYFPEYIQAYTKTCISYLKGQRSFPFGNPTVECDDLMKGSKNNDWVEDSVKIEYSSSKKFIYK